MILKSDSEYLADIRAEAAAKKQQREDIQRLNNVDYVCNPFDGVDAIAGTIQEVANRQLRRGWIENEFQVLIDVHDWRDTCEIHNWMFSANSDQFDQDLVCDFQDTFIINGRRTQRYEVGVR